MSLIDFCVLEVLHNEPYADGAAIDCYSVETLLVPNQDNEFSSENCCIITVIFENADGYIQIDCWFCYIALKKECRHDRSKIRSSCIAIIDCDWVKTEIIGD